MLAVWVPELPFQLARQRESELVGRPLGFRNPEQGRTPTLWMVDRIARKAGLEPGIPVDIALHQDPGLVVLDPMPSTWMDARACLGRHLLAYSPLGRLGRFGEGFVDLRGTERLHGPMLDAAERLRMDLMKVDGWSAHGGLSQSFSASRLAAKTEDQVRMIEAGQEAPFMAPYALGALSALEARSRDRLQHFGLHRVAQVQPMEVHALGRIIPPTEAFQVLRQARGEDQDRLPPLEVVQASETLRKIIMPPAHKHDLGLASWVWEAAWAWRLDGRFVHRLRLSWWDVDDLYHVLPFGLSGEDLWACCRDLERQFMAEATRRVLIQRLELEAWLGQTPGTPLLLAEDRVHKRLALEATALRLHRRFGHQALRQGA
jgi:hypothetical protein